MSLIDELEKEDLTISKAKELLKMYEALYIEEKDKALSDEYYETSLYLESRLMYILHMKQEKESEESENKAFYESKIEELKTENDILFKRIVNEDEKALSKKDIMARFGKESAWALNLLKLLYQQNLGRKIGKEYFTTKEELNEFMKLSKGKDFFI